MIHFFSISFDQPQELITCKFWRFIITTCQKVMFSLVSVCLFTRKYRIHPHVISTHDVLDIIVEAPSQPWHCPLWTSDIWWSSLEACSYCSFEDPQSHIWWCLLKHVLLCFLVYFGVYGVFSPPVAAYYVSGMN